MTDEPAILFLDIETKLIDVDTFRLGEQRIGYEQIVDDNGGRSVHCVGLRWRGKKAKVTSEWKHGYRGMMERVHRALSEADAVATYNGARFDLPILQGQFLLLGMDPPPPPTQIDLYKSARKLGFICNKLDYLANLLGVGSKVEHTGRQLWRDVRAGCPKAQKLMTKYCAGDVDLTERVYDRMLPYVTMHPRLHRSHAGEDICGKCGSDNVQKRGENKAEKTWRQRYFCNDCRSWSSGAPRRYAA